MGRRPARSGPSEDSFCRICGPNEQLQAFQHTIFMQDQPVLESQSPKCLPISERAPVRELHSAADRSASAYRRFLLASGITYGTC